MTQEEKELLLKDISARLLYGIKVKRKSKQFGEDIVLVDMYNFSYFLEITDFEHEAIQLYLRPMSSMTEEEKEDYNSKFERRDFSWEIYYGSTDWLNSKTKEVFGYLSLKKVDELPDDITKLEELGTPIPMGYGPKEDVDYTEYKNILNFEKELPLEAR